MKCSGSLLIITKGGVAVAVTAVTAAAAAALEVMRVVQSKTAQRGVPAQCSFPGT